MNNEKDTLKNFAKLLGVESVFEQIEAKKSKEEKLLEDLKQTLGIKVEAKVEEQAPVVIAEEVIVENPVAPMPELPVDTIVTQSVKALYQGEPKDIQKAVDKTTELLRREMDAMKKSITDLHSFARRQSQMGGGGEVNFRYLDDVNRATMAPGNDNFVLEYDAATKKVQFTEDIGPVRTIKLNTAGPNITTVPGMLAWNTVEDCMDIHQNDGTTLQTGLENYIRVHNDTGVPLLNGEVVRFSGVDPGVTGVPTAELMDANELQDPLFLIGVITSDIPIQGTGRATTLGNVRNINTTGSSSNETWVIGDLLWVHPTLAGKLTKVKPTAPDLAVSVAAVMTVHATQGVLLVRPNFAPRLSYGTFLNTIDHVADAINTPTYIPIDTVTRVRGFELTGDTDTRITCQISGLYNFAVSYQITSTNASAKDIYFWIRRNGVDQPYTTRRQSINGNGIYQTFACTWTVSLTDGQYVELMWAVTDLTARLTHTDATAFAPSSPSVLLTVTEAAL